MTLEVERKKSLIILVNPYNKVIENNLFNGIFKIKINNSINKTIPQNGRKIYLKN